MFNIFVKSYKNSKGHWRYYLNKAIKKNVSTGEHFFVVHLLFFFNLLCCFFNKQFLKNFIDLYFVCFSICWCIIPIVMKNYNVKKAILNSRDPTEQSHYDKTVYNRLSCITTLLIDIVLGRHIEENTQVLFNSTP